MESAVKRTKNTIVKGEISQESEDLLPRGSLKVPDESEGELSLVYFRVTIRGRVRKATHVLACYINELSGIVYRLRPVKLVTGRRLGVYGGQQWSCNMRWWFAVASSIRHPARGVSYALEGRLLAEWC